ncbi:hypothetical protein CYLTODRAFT_415973 [Cylindrobasidium torrendii FP15055 ss-10]|uniref:Uncharacterized protein n=1 Tax=Cylindrobasidium torrendii FP15055 ss-10 TaxID=1314674 RepID=A0A0D7AS92_9AGAR|nr:hypothetical protein CYLTODRAFT_415973 [Cylindrobasidium torrendii FP15055 ss-10]
MYFDSDGNAERRYPNDVRIMQGRLATATSGFAITQEDIKYSGTTNVGEAVCNEYASGRFQVKCLRPPICLCMGQAEEPVIEDMVWQGGDSLPCRKLFHSERYKMWMKVATEKGY